MSGIVPLLPALGVGLSAVSQVASGRAAADAARTQAANLAASADRARREAANEAAARREDYRKLGEARKTGYAASGIALDSGSVLDNLAGNDADAEVDALRALHGGESRAAEFASRAEAARQQGSSAYAGGLLGGLGRGVTGAASLLGVRFGGRG